ncbi:MAG: hypothetical protein ACI4PW_07750 [Alphaproteobacteria bacterium]
MRPRSYGPLPETTGGGDRFNLFDRLKAHAPPLKSYLLSKTKVSDGTNALKHQLKSFLLSNAKVSDGTNALKHQLKSFFAKQYESPGRHERAQAPTEKLFC